jgi:hypothetical protein
MAPRLREGDTVRKLRLYHGSAQRFSRGFPVRLDNKPRPR